MSRRLPIIRLNASVPCNLRQNANRRPDGILRETGSGVTARHVAVTISLRKGGNMGHSPIRKHSVAVLLALAGSLGLAGCARNDRPVPSGFIRPPPAQVRCLVAPGTTESGIDPRLEAEILATVMPACRIVASGSADVLVELSWARRDKVVGLYPGAANAVLSDAVDMQGKRGVIYVLGFYATQINSGTVIADARVTQAFRNARKQSQERDLAIALAQRAAGLPKVRRPVQDRAR